MIHPPSRKTTQEKRVSLYPQTFCSMQTVTFTAAHSFDCNDSKFEDPRASRRSYLGTFARASNAI